MNHPLLQNSFQLDGPITTDGDYSGVQRPYPVSTSYSMEDDDHHRRSGAVGSALAHSVPIPATNNLRYNTQQSAMHDLPYGTSPTLLMSPSDSCSDSFSPATGSLYSHSSPLSYDNRMSDYRSHRAPTLHPPTGMSSTVQSPGNAPLLGRSDNYPGTYAIPRGPIPSLTSLSDIARGPQFTATPRSLDCAMDRTSNLMFSQPGAMYLDHSQRVPPLMADAPPFAETHPVHSVVSGNQIVRPDIGAKIHKGFFQVDDKWTCYRRNYFSISCSFSFHPSVPVHGPFHLKYEGRNTRIHQFSMSISAIVNMQQNEVRELVQHTPKRDKQSERPPQRVVLQPCQTTAMVPSLGSTSTGGQHGFPLMSQSAGMPLEYNSSYSGAPQQSQPPTQHTFERIQFQKATANNGKRRAQQQYYNLVVDLYAEVTGTHGGNEWVKIARKLSSPMVVRGRSPGHYKDGRRDSSTSMGPDGGSGGAGDGSGGAVLTPGLGQASRSHLALMPGPYDSQRGGHSYGRADYHQMTAADHSPLSASPHISSSSSSTFEIGMMSSDSLDPMDSIKSTSSMESYQDPNYGIMDGRKESQFRNHLPPPFEYDPISRASESSGTSFSEAYDPIASMVSNEPGESHFLKHPPRMAPQSYHHSSPGGYDTIYSARSGGGSSPYSRLPNSQSLCT
ncbi:p53-like transcription factor [Aspergillus cavernicola]|uniref:P53-like transcription factor n=1 Tax=Aspergillus cavernicola TaxID=176166 RepID=A0ABR4J307_9EURO